MADRLRLVRPRSAVERCRGRGCELPAQGSRGFCAPCERVYLAVQELRTQLLERRRAHVRARHAETLAALSPGHRERLIAHLVARDTDEEPVAGLEALGDFLGELQDLGLLPRGRP